MRLWSLHPKYLDAKGLVALWREGLLAQKVLAGKTKGYRHHPQLERFRAARDPLGAIGAYLALVALEAERRHYRFDATKIHRRAARLTITVTRGQLEHETRHLLAKLKTRAPAIYRELAALKRFTPHPLFRRRPGAVEKWEKGL